MTSPTPSSKPSIVRLGRRAIHQLRASLERDTLQAAAYLQEAGFAGGEELFVAFTGWLSEKHGVDHPSELDVKFLGEAMDERLAEFPSCHLSCGLLADFLGRMSQDVVAVMEVECRSRGEARCRFLAGSPETLGAVYDSMAQGAGYKEAIGVIG